MMINIQALSKRFERPSLRKNGEGITAVHPLTLTIPQGELFGLLGPNGAGKTTLVKMLCTLVLPTSGQATIAGYSLDQGSAIRSTVGLVLSDERSFYWRLSAQRNLAFFAAMHGLRGAKARERVVAVLRDVDLADVGKRPFGQLSSGMKQRLAIARGLLHQPQILFLDEPSRSLDPVATQNLHELIQRLRQEQGMTIFLITHDLAEAEKLCDRVGLMHKGKLGKIGSPATLRRELWTKRRYLLTIDAPKTAVSIDHQSQLLTNGRM
ncbi:MAG: ABC transporter ATP-binding protein, partial [Chloroflexota bacterium]